MKSLLNKIKTDHTPRGVEFTLDSASEQDSSKYFNKNNNSIFDQSEKNGAAAHYANYRNTKAKINSSYQVHSRTNLTSRQNGQVGGGLGSRD